MAYVKNTNYTAIAEGFAPLLRRYIRSDETEGLLVGHALASAYRELLSEARRVLIDTIGLAEQEADEVSCLLGQAGDWQAAFTAAIRDNGGVDFASLASIDSLQEQAEQAVPHIYRWAVDVEASETYHMSW